MARCTLLLTVIWLSASLAFAEAPKFDRTIGKEPAYRSKAPKYGLLVFGPEGKDRVWLVLDGDTLYVDRNGSGDLTEPGKKVDVEKKPGRDPAQDGFRFEVGELKVGGRQHKGLAVSFAPLKQYDSAYLGKRPEVQAALKKDAKALAVSLSVDVEVPGMKGGGVGGRLAYSAGPIDMGGVLQFADGPGEAPVVHCGGPLEISFYAELPILRVGRGSELVLVVGTPGVGPGTFAMLGYEGTIPTNVKPVAEFLFPAPSADEPRPREKLEIMDRC